MCSECQVIPGPGFNFENSEIGGTPTKFRVFKVGLRFGSEAATLNTLKLDGVDTMFKIFKLTCPAHWGGDPALTSQEGQRPL